MLRALAATLVLVMHATQAVSVHILGRSPEQYWHFGGIGVHIFFVISGIIIFLSAPAASGGAPARAFLLRRLIRVVPPYWLYTSLKLVLLLGTLGGAAWPWSGGQLAASYLFIPRFAPDGELFPLLQVGWTLNYEMVFYAAFALAVWAGWQRTLACTALIGLLFVLGTQAPADSALSFYGRGILLDFVLGLLIAQAVQRRALAGPALSAALASAGAVLAWLLQDTGYDSFFISGLPSALLAYGVLGLEQPLARSFAARAFTVLGDASYALYLTHPFVIAALVRLLARLHGGPVATGLVLVAACLAVSVLAYQRIERPMLKSLQQRLLRRPLTVGHG